MKFTKTFQEHVRHDVCARANRSQRLKFVLTLEACAPIPTSSISSLPHRNVIVLILFGKICLYIKFLSVIFYFVLVTCLLDQVVIF